ncbi:hypothetical protein GG851_26740 [Bordetella petrii]|nr:hypothetical protein [Bordetella petrii]
MRLSILIALLWAFSLQAPALATESVASTGTLSEACVDVEVGGYRALSYDCLSRQMAPSKNHAPDAPALAAEEIAKQGPNRLGLFNQAATSNRMGNQFGQSAFPQRPPPVQYNSPLLR